MVGKFLSILFLLFIVIFSPFPNGVYTLLRIVITLFASWSAFRYSLLHQNSGVWIFGFVAILFNPVITVHFTKDVWLHLDLLTAMIFIISFYFDAKQVQPSSQPGRAGDTIFGKKLNFFSIMPKKFDFSPHFV